jgi:hypothetical protein
VTASTPAPDRDPSALIEALAIRQAVNRAAFLERQELRQIKARPTPRRPG